MGGEAGGRAVGLGGRERIVRRGAESIEPRDGVTERVLTAHFHAIDSALAGIDRFGDVARIAAKVIFHEGWDGHDLDEVVYLLVKNGNRVEAARREIVFIRQPKLRRAVGIQAPITRVSAYEVKSAY